MKRLILIAALAATPVLADTYAMENNVNGEIVLTDRVCRQTDKLHQAYSYGTGIYIEGCWAIIDGDVHILWNANGRGDRRVYPVENFYKKTTSKKKGTAL